MGNFIHLIIIAFFVITLGSCTKTLTITSSPFELPEEGGNINVKVETNTEFNVIIEDDGKA